VLYELSNFVFAGLLRGCALLSHDDNDWKGYPTNVAPCPTQRRFPSYATGGVYTSSPAYCFQNAGVVRHHAAFKNSFNILYTIRLLQSQLCIALLYYIQTH
jgi:hypothetical protein